MKIVIEPQDVEWIVNDNAELGVKIGDQFFFMYKGESLPGTPRHDNGKPRMWRKVEKREFGEVCRPPAIREKIEQIGIQDFFSWNGEGWFSVGEGWQSIPDPEAKQPNIASSPMSPEYQ